MKDNRGDKIIREKVIGKEIEAASTIGSADLLWERLNARLDEQAIAEPQLKQAKKIRLYPLLAAASVVAAIVIFLGTFYHKNQNVPVCAVRTIVKNLPAKKLIIAAELKATEPGIQDAKPVYAKRPVKEEQIVNSEKAIVPNPVKDERPSVVVAAVEKPANAQTVLKRSLPVLSLDELMKSPQNTQPERHTAGTKVRIDLPSVTASDERKVVSLTENSSPYRIKIKL